MLNPNSLRSSGALATLAFALVFADVGAVAQQLKVLHNFGQGVDGAQPQAPLLRDAAGNLYGTTSLGGTHGGGIAFELSRSGANGAWTETILYNFKSNILDAAYPSGGLVFDAMGNLYGTTSAGGAGGFGTVFELTPTIAGGWEEHIIYGFHGDTEGNSPSGSLVFDAAGNLYGTTVTGGSSGSGTIFELSPRAGDGWAETTIYNFGTGLKSGGYPQSGVILDSAGNLYGTTEQGGAGIDGGDGAVFELGHSSEGWGEELLIGFGDSYQGDGPNPAGSNPSGALIFDAFGNLYGATILGGRGPCNPGLGCGTVFELAREPDGTWSETVLYAFDGKDGSGPSGSLTLDPAGNLYGATYANGSTSGCCGTVFRLSPATGGRWTETILGDFYKNGRGPLFPNGGLIFDGSGNLYGTSLEGGIYGGSYPYGGTVFEITP